MSSPISIPDYALSVVERLEHYGFEAYVVGGCVRDSLMGREPKDWDVCSNALPEEALRVFRRFHVIKTGLKHGTVTVMSQRQPVELTTYRIDGDYSDNRHPDAVQFVSRVEEDLSRRDFSINAMAYSPTRGLVDAFGGQEDLEKRVIRCVGEPDARFDEDGLRILRALRFASRFNFDIARETAEAVRRKRYLLENVSAERIFKELKGILEGEGILNILLGFPEVFCCIIPELAPSVGFDQHTPYHCYDVWTHAAHAVAACPPQAGLRLAMLLHDVAKPQCYSWDDVKKRGHCYGHAEAAAPLVRRIMQRLKSDNAMADEVVTLVREHDIDWPSTPADMRRLVGRLGAEMVEKLFLIKAADRAAKSDFAKERKDEDTRRARILFAEVMEAEAAFSVRDLCIGGRQLMAMGMKAGPSMRLVLEQLLAEVQEEKLVNREESLQARAAELIAALPPAGSAS